METYECVISTVATAALVLKYHAISIHNADQLILLTFIVLDQFHSKVPQSPRTELETEVIVFNNPIVLGLNVENIIVSFPSTITKRKNMRVLSFTYSDTRATRGVKGIFAPFGIWPGSTALGLWCFFRAKCTGSPVCM